MENTNKQLNLYNKYRPKSFSEIVGQQTTINLILQIFKQEKLIQAFIFYGSNGLGKTSLARILAKAWNCDKFKELGDVCNSCEYCISVDKNSPDMYEIDAASNSGVDHMRELIRHSRYMATNLKNKVYIVDEAHNLSHAAWNALLKTIEEPHSENIFFIFVTTNIQRIPPTIISRCQKCNFSKLSNSDLHTLLDRVVSEEGRAITDDAKSSLALLSNGSARECLTLLEQAFLKSDGLIQNSDLERVFALANKKDVLEFISFVLNKDLSSANEALTRFAALEKNLFHFFTEMMDCFVDLYLFEQTSNTNILSKLIDSEIAPFMNRGIDFLSCLDVLEKACLNRFSNKQKPLVWAQITLFHLIERISDVPTKSLPIKQTYKSDPESVSNFSESQPQSVKTESKQEEIKQDDKQEELIEEVVKPAKKTPKTRKSKKSLISEQIIETQIEVESESEEELKKLDSKSEEINSQEEIVLPKVDELQKSISQQIEKEYIFSSLEEKKIIYGLKTEYMNESLSLDNYSQYYISLTKSQSEEYLELIALFEKAVFLTNNKDKQKVLITTDKTVVVLFGDKFSATRFNFSSKDPKIKQALKNAFIGEYEWFALTKEQFRKYQGIAKSGTPVDSSIFAESEEIDRFEEAWEFLEAKQE